MFAVENAVTDHLGGISVYLEDVVSVGFFLKYSRIKRMEEH